jgi:hypothetical protein
MLVLTLLLPTAFAQSSKTGKVEMTDAEIRQQIIKESINSFKGSCPCPYNLDADGQMCGHRSAYSQRGGSSPICFEKGVTQRMVEEYRNKMKRRWRGLSQFRNSTDPAGLHT